MMCTHFTSSKLLYHTFSSLAFRQTSVHMSQRVRVRLAIDADALAKSSPPLTSGYHQFDFFDSGTSSVQL
jgi:hypothetical protein